MALTEINLTDPVSSLVTKTNTISADLGDASTLLTTAKNAVAAINEIRAQIIDIDDSSEVVAISRGGLSVNNDSADASFSLSYSTSTGVIKLKANLFSDSAGGILYDSAAGRFSIAPNSVLNTMIKANTITADQIANTTITNTQISTNTITSNRFSSVVSLIIYDSTGTPVKTLYSPGS